MYVKLGLNKELWEGFGDLVSLKNTGLITGEIPLLIDTVTHEFHIPVDFPCLALRGAVVFGPDH